MASCESWNGRFGFSESDVAADKSGITVFLKTDSLQNTANQLFIPWTCIGTVSSSLSTFGMNNLELLILEKYNLFVLTFDYSLFLN